MNFVVIGTCLMYIATACITLKIIVVVVFG